MSSEDLGRAIFAANDVALQWYALTHQTTVPGAPGTVTITPTGATFGSGTLILAGLLIVGLVIVLK
jgi:hypothetical protein